MLYAATAITKSQACKLPDGYYKKELSVKYARFMTKSSDFIKRNNAIVYPVLVDFYANNSPTSMLFEYDCKTKKWKQIGDNIGESLYQMIELESLSNNWIISFVGVGDMWGMSQRTVYLKTDRRTWKHQNIDLSTWGWYTQIIAPYPKKDIRITTFHSTSDDNIFTAKLQVWIFQFWEDEIVTHTIPIQVNLVKNTLSEISNNIRTTQSANITPITYGNTDFRKIGGKIYYNKENYKQSPEFLPFEGIDTDSFETLNQTYVKDKYNVYFFNRDMSGNWPEKIPSADAKSFQIIGNGLYARDYNSLFRENPYTWSYEHTDFANNFQIINNNNDGMTIRYNNKEYLVNFTRDKGQFFTQIP
jgi:hypothetical protein